jgi:hypothetical protein
MEFHDSVLVSEPADSSGLPCLEAPPSPWKRPRFDRPLVRTGLLLALTTAYLLPLTQVLYRVGDDGTLVYGAQRVSEGAIPGRDFLEVMGPACFYWLGLFFKLFGAGWQVTRLFLLFTGVTTVALLYSIARQVCRESGAVLLWLFVLVVGMPVWPTISHHWDSNLFATLALWCYLKLETTEHPAWAVAVGSLAGITTCFMQQKGCFLLLGLAASIVLRRLWPQSHSRERVGWNTLWLLFGSYAAVGIGVIAAFWHAGALHDLLYANVIWPLSAYHDINVSPYGQLLISVAIGPSVQSFGAGRAIPGFICAGLSLIPFLVVAMLPLLSAGPVLVFPLLRDKRIRWSPRLAVLLAGFGLWLSELHRKDIFHLTYGSPFLLIAFLGSVQLIPKTPIRRAVMGTLAVSLAVFGALTLMAHLRGVHAVETRRGTIMSVSDENALRFLSASVKEREFVFIYPYYPIYYYLADVRNPTRFSILLYGYNTPAQFNEVIHNLEEKRVRYVLWDTEVYGDKLRKWFPGYRHPAADKLKLEQYLQKRYEVIGVKSGFRVLRRVSD